MEENKSKKIPKILKKIGLGFDFDFDVTSFLSPYCFMCHSYNNGLQETHNFLSEKMEADVTLSNIDVSIFKVYRSQTLPFAIRKDTLMNVASLDVSLSRNLFSLLKKRIEIKDISLINPQFSLETDRLTEKT